MQMRRTCSLEHITTWWRPHCFMSSSPTMYVTSSATYRLVKKSTLALYVHTLFTGVMYSIPLSPTAGLRQLQHCVLYEGKRGRTRSNAPPLSLPDSSFFVGHGFASFPRDACYGCLHPNSNNTTVVASYIVCLVGEN